MPPDMNTPLLAPRDIFEKMLEFGVMPTFDIVFQYGDEGFIFLKRTIAPYQNVWAFPGLRMLKNESINDTLTRIARDELGLTINPEHKTFLDQYVGKFTTEFHRQDISTGYLIKLDGTEKLTPNPDHFSQMKISKELPEKTGAMYAHYFHRALPHTQRFVVPPRTTGNILFEKLEKMGLHPQWLTDYGVFTVDHKGQNYRFSHSLLPFNSQLAAYAATDKYTTRLLADQIGEKNIPFCLPTSLMQAREFFDRYAPIIVKPTTGQRADQVEKVTDWEKLRGMNWKNMLLEKYIPGTELRVLCLDGEVLGCAEKTLSPTKAKPWEKRWKTVLPEDFARDVQKRASSLLKHLGLRWGAVDFIRDEHGDSWLLEVNASPGFVHFHEPDEGPVIDIAEKVLEKIVAL